MFGMPPSMTGMGTPWGMPNPQSQWAPLPPAQMWGGMGGMPGMGNGYFQSNVNLPVGGQSGAYTNYGGVSTVNPQAQPADYESLREFSDLAHQEAMRYLQPQMEIQQKALDQQLIDQGIDPTSEYGQFMSDQLARQQSDLISKSSFDALAFGQGIQDQYYQQDLGRSELANRMAANKMANELGYYQSDTARMGNELSYLANMAGVGAQYAANMAGVGAQYANIGANQLANNQRYNLGLGELDLARAGMSFDQMMGLEDLAYREWMANEDARRFDTSLIYQAILGGPPNLGYTSPPAFGLGGGGNPYDYWLGLADRSFPNIPGGQ